MGWQNSRNVTGDDYLAKSAMSRDDSLPNPAPVEPFSGLTLVKRLRYTRRTESAVADSAAFGVRFSLRSALDASRFPRGLAAWCSPGWLGVGPGTRCRWLISPRTLAHR